MNKHKHPENYKKRFYNKSYFEGWYYKQVAKDGKHTISFIPGVNFNKSGAYSFIQCLHLNQNNELEAYSVNYDIKDFKTEDQPFSAHVGKSKFSLNKISLAIESELLNVKGSVKLNNLTAIKRSIINPNIMGAFSYIPFMECNHGLISMNHTLEGCLEINGEMIDFTGGKGYLEKDWGRSFPSAYVWIQSNHFEDDSTALFCSVAKIPFLGFSFAGFISNITHKGKEYRFATYNASKILLDVRTENGIHLIIKNRKYILELKGLIKDSKKLFAPKMGAMDKTIKEGLSGSVEILLKDRKGNVIIDSQSKKCGMEIVEKLETI